MTAQVACNFVYLFRKNLISLAELQMPFCCSRQVAAKRSKTLAFNQSLPPTGSTIIVNQSDLGNLC